MKVILSTFLFLFCFGYSQADFCQYNFSASDLESSVIEEILSFIINGVIVCTDQSVDNSKIKFWLYTRESPLGSEVELNVAEISANKKVTKVLIPGWLCNITNDLMPELKDAYLQRYDANVFIVDWSYYAKNTYGEAYCHTFNIGLAIAKFLGTLDERFGIGVDTVHIVGHSMGGQLAGITGYHVKRLYGKKLMRITGLDPAGPLYTTTLDNSKKLDNSDADFVDVIHTNGLVLGYNSKCGHADFYPNCGISQAGCKSTGSILSPDFIISKIGCDHLRSVDYMIESITSANFKAKKRLLITCFSISGESIMGEDAITNRNVENYILDTNEKHPFAMG